MDFDLREGFLSLVHDNASSVLQLADQFEECEKEFELEKASLRKQILELKEKEEERVRLMVEEEKEKEKESELKQVLEADMVRLVVEKQIKEVVTQLGLLQDSSTKEIEAKEKEFVMKQRVESEERKKEAEEIEISLKKLEAMEEEVGLVSELINEKSCELVMAVKEFELKQRVETEKRKEEAERIEISLKELNSLNKTVEKKTIELKKKEEKFQLKQKEGALKIEEKKKFLSVKEKELEEKEKKLKLKQRDLQEGSKTHKRSRLEFGSSSLAKKQKPIREQHQSSDEEIIKKETDLACVLHGETSSDPNEIVCRDDEPGEEDIPDPEFSSFSNTIESFAVNQLWALYDPIDAMPRYYAWIKSISKPKLSMKVTWLESVHNAANQKLIPIACGRFKQGTSETKTKTLSMFSHNMHLDKTGINITINPRKGETWALFTDWRKAWNTNRERHEPPYRYDFVEILTEFNEVYGIGVAYLGRVEGFTSVYEQAEQHGVVQMMIPSDEMFRFSHQVPSSKMIGNEKDGVPAGSFELDPAALP